MRRTSLLQSFGHALAGVAAAWRTQRSFRIQTGFAAALPVALALVGPRPSRTGRCAW